MPKFKKLILIVLGLFVVVIIVNYFTSERIVTLTQTSHSDWRTYVNEGARYSIQYPSNVSFSEDQPFSNNTNYRNIDLVFGNDMKGIRVSPLAKNVDWAESETCDSKKIKVIIDNSEWEKAKCKIGYMDTPPDILEVYSLDAGEFIYKIQLNYGKDMTGAEQDYMESILSTFRFIPWNSVVTDTSTYTNDRLKVSFQYPSDWRIIEGPNQIAANTTSRNGSLRFDLYKSDSTLRPDILEVGNCKIQESTGLAKLSCSDMNLPEYVVRYGNNTYRLVFSKNIREVIDTKYEEEFDQITTKMFDKNKDSFQKILSSITFMK